MKKTSKRNSWIITLPLIAVAGAYLYFFFLPTKKAIAELSEELATKRTFIEQSSNLRISAEEANRELNHALDYTKVWRDAAPTQATLSSLLGEINQLAKDTSVEISAFNPQQRTLNETFGRVPLNIELECTTDSLFAFLRAIEQLSPEIWVEALNIEQTGQHGQTVKAELRLVIFTSNSEKSD